MSPKKKRPAVHEIKVAVVVTIPLTEEEMENLTVEDGNRDAVSSRAARGSNVPYLTGYYGRLQLLGQKAYLILPGQEALSELIAEAFHAEFAKQT